MERANEQSYEEMILTLENFMKQAGEQYAIMKKAGEDCVDNTENDPAAVASNDNLQESVQKLEGTQEALEGIIKAMQQEIEAIREAAERAQRAANR